MWTSTLELNMKRVLPTRILGFFWRGAYFSSFAPLQIQNLPRQPLTSNHGNWVRVHNLLSGICGSDLHLAFVDGDLRIAPAALPGMHTYPGHEVVGEVVEIGEHVQNLHVGDRVVLQSGPSCKSVGIQPLCRSCAAGNYSLCEKASLPGEQQIGGGWSEEMLLHEQQLFRIPDDMETEQAVMLEPTAVALHAVLRRPPQEREKVLIVGAGTIGLLTLQIIRSLFPKAEVSVLAKHAFQVEQATRMGAAHIIYKHGSYESVEKTTGARLYQGPIGNKMLLGGYDVIYDTVGTEHTIHHNLRWARAGGTVVVVGVSLHHARIDLSPVWYQEVNLIGAMSHGMEYWPINTTQQHPTFAIASELIVNGLLHPEKLITHRFALSNFREALQTATAKKESRAIKVVFDADLLPASSVPTARQQTGKFRTGNFSTQHIPQVAVVDDDTLSLPVPERVQRINGPSNFTMTQSEDFTEDFDNMQFSNPKPRRPPAPLQFYDTSDEIPEDSLELQPSAATNSASEALKIVEEGNEDL